MSLHVANARGSIARRRSASVHCSAVAFRVRRKPAKLVSAAWIADGLAWRRVMVRRVCRRVATPCNQSGRREIASKGLGGWASRTNSVHPLYTKATMRAMIRQRARS